MSANQKEILHAALDACEAALKYDRSICGRAVRGEASLREDGSGIAEGEDLDKLYFDWQKKATRALALSGRKTRT